MATHLGKIKPNKVKPPVRMRRMLFWKVRCLISCRLGVRPGSLGAGSAFRSQGFAAGLPARCWERPCCGPGRLLCPPPAQGPPQWPSDAASQTPSTPAGAAPPATCLGHVSVPSLCLLTREDFAGAPSTPRFALGKPKRLSVGRCKVLAKS